MLYERNLLNSVTRVCIGCVFWVLLLGSHGTCDTYVVVDDSGYHDPYGYGYGDGYSDGYYDGYASGYDDSYGMCGDITGACGCWGPVMLGSYSMNPYCSSGYDIAMGCYDGFGQPIWCAGGYQAWGLQCACY